LATSREFPPAQLITKFAVSDELSEKIMLTCLDVSSMYFALCLSKKFVPFFLDNSEIDFVSKP
jgi:hypothetical protein